MPSNDPITMSDTEKPEESKYVWVVLFADGEHPESIWDNELDALRAANGPGASYVRKVKLNDEYQLLAL